MLLYHIIDIYADGEYVLFEGQPQKMDKKVLGEDKAQMVHASALHLTTGEP